MPSQLPLTPLAGQSTWFDTFSQWMPFSQRSDALDQWGYRMVDYPGVYLLAHFPDGPPEGPADFHHDAIIYVGLSKDLAARLYAFERSMDGRYGHAGGTSYHEHFGAQQPGLHL